MPVADPPESALARSQAARRRRVLDARLQLAAVGGFEAVQMRDVASAADVALGTVYRYFTSKERLLLEAMAEQQADLRAYLDVHPPTQDTPAERVVASLDNSLRVMGTDYIDVFNLHAVEADHYDHVLNVIAPALIEQKAKGKIVDGHVIAEPVDAKLPLFGNNTVGDMIYKGLRLDLDLNKAAPDGSYTGMLAGYRDWENWWDYIRKIEFLTVTGQWSCPAIWVASQELADGYPDPKTGKCTAISEAMDIQAVPAFVVPREAQS